MSRRVDRWVLRVMATLLLTGVLPVMAHAAGVTPAAVPGVTPATQRYVWYDGAQQRTVRLDPQLLAEFGRSTGAQARATVTGGLTGARPAVRHGAVQLWRLDGASGDGPSAARQLRDANPAVRVSPVFRDGGTGGRLRALPGNIIVTFKPDWDAARIAAWSAARNLEIVEKLRFGTNLYVIRTGPGLEALETANRIHDSGEVLGATPNWWTETALR